MLMWLPELGTPQFLILLSTVNRRLQSLHPSWVRKTPGSRGIPSHSQRPTRMPAAPAEATRTQYPQAVQQRLKCSTIATSHQIHTSPAWTPSCRSISPLIFQGSHQSTTSQLIDLGGSLLHRRGTSHQHRWPLRPRRTRTQIHQRT